ncbi:MAG: glycerophosphodiester phosphodiesterase family protein [Methylocella sp.]
MAPLPATGGALNAPAWLTARPIAHRGLHGKARGLIENTRAAAKAAIAQSYAIECDIQLARDGEAVVFHDFTLERLTHAKGRVDQYSADELAAIAFRACGETIPRLSVFLDEIAGRTPLIIEIKSGFDGDERLAARLLAVLSGYSGPAAVKSFDPVVLAFIRAEGLDRPLGLVAQAHYGASEWPELTPRQRVELATLRDFSAIRPDFLSWHVGDLPHATPELCRAGIGMPVMTWTVRSEDDRARAAIWADQMIFEGFEP